VADADGRAHADAEAGARSGLAIEGHGVVLTALRRRGEWLELRVVAETPTATEAVIRGPFDAARDADLLGRPAATLLAEPGVLRLALGPWEIRTVHLRPASETTASGTSQPGE
jgi:alpha-mannosidase